MNKIVFLCSGGGGNLKFIDKAIESRWLPEHQIVSVITDRECAAGKYAQERGIPCECPDFSINSQHTLLDVLLFYKPNIVLTTVHRILSDRIVNEFRDCLLNLHYSLLPSFPGIPPSVSGKIGSRSVQAAINYGACLTGATVHHVNKTIDGGKPYVQIALPIHPNDTFGNLMNTVFRAGCIALFIAVNSFDRKLDERNQSMVLQILGRDALVNPGMLLPSGLWSESFWSSIK